MKYKNCLICGKELKRGYPHTKSKSKDILPYDMRGCLCKTDWHKFSHGWIGIEDLKAVGITPEEIKW